MIFAGEVKPPLCVWQARKSFRKESLDGANAAKMRYKEFYQLEFQCIYSTSTKAPIHDRICTAMFLLLGRTYPGTALELSDRIPSYSLTTNDIVVNNNGKPMEVASISQRKDFSIDGYEVVEAAFGLDRLVDLKSDPAQSCGL